MKRLTHSITPARLGSLVFSVLALLLIGASSAKSISLTLAGAHGQVVESGGQVSVTVTLDTETTTGITLLSIGVLFDDARLAYNKAASSATSYMFYVPPSKGNPNNFLKASTTCGGYPSPGGYYSNNGACSIRVNTTNQVNLDFVSADLAAGTSSTNSGVSLMATLVFDVLDGSGPAAIGLTQTGPGNVIGQPGGGSTTATLLGSGSVCINPIPGPDSDGDGIGDNCDNCPSTSNPGQANFDFDGFGDACDPDRDGDLVPNEFDAFPDDPYESSDIDADGIGDNSDNCPENPNPGQGDADEDGQGNACDVDSDNDLVPDEFDAFPYDPSESSDIDADGAGDNGDNCPATPNPGQEDADGDGQGNACDSDSDNDLIPDEFDAFPYDPSEASDIDADGVGDNRDNCPGVPNLGQEDLDGDGVGDVCDPDIDNDGIPNDGDNCPFTTNPGQENADNDGLGDACDPDRDDDGLANVSDNCPLDSNADQADGDGDGVGDICDNCPLDPNPSQQDGFGSPTGDACSDEDLDGLLDSLETNTGIFISLDNTGSDPLLPDTDGDGLGDGKEVLEYGSDPNNTDTDGDTHPDGADNCVIIANTDQANEEMGDEDTSLPGIQQYGNICDADLDSSGLVNTGDFFGYFRGCFGAVVTGPDCAPSDFDGSGIVNTTDFFGYFLPAFGNPPGPGIDTPAPEVSFTGIGDLPGGAFESRANSVADDALVVVGSSASASGSEAFRWEDGVITGLGDFPGGSFGSNASDVSADGSVVVGGGHHSLGGEAFRWDVFGMVALGEIPGGAYNSGACCVSADGRIAAGSSGWSSIYYHGFRWEDGAFSSIGAPQGPEFYAHGMSNDGTHIVGGGNWNGRWTGWIWQNGYSVLVPLNPSWAFADAISDDGSVVVGSSGLLSNVATWHAVRWINGGAPQSLGDMPGETGGSYARHLSGDGSRVVGWAEVATGKTAFVWDEGTGMRRLRDVLSVDHGLDLTGWTLTEASHISADGRKIVGYGTNPDGNTEGWLAVLPAPAAMAAAAPSSLTAQDAAFLAQFTAGSETDADNDGVADSADNCSLLPNPSQLDADADGFGNACDADLNNDGGVGLDDVAEILAAAGTTSTTNPAADLNGDGAVGLDDASAALGRVGTAPGPSALACPGAATCQ